MMGGKFPGTPTSCKYTANFEFSPAPADFDLFSCKRGRHLKASRICHSIPCMRLNQRGKLFIEYTSFMCACIKAVFGCSRAFHSGK